MAQHVKVRATKPHGGKRESSHDSCPLMSHTSTRTSNEPLFCCCDSTMAQVIDHGRGLGLSFQRVRNPPWPGGIAANSRHGGRHGAERAT